jgi:hypothetical protein
VGVAWRSDDFRPRPDPYGAPLKDPTGQQATRWLLPFVRRGEGQDARAIYAAADPATLPWRILRGLTNDRVLVAELTIDYPPELRTKARLTVIRQRSSADTRRPWVWSCSCGPNPYCKHVRLVEDTCGWRLGS